MMKNFKYLFLLLAVSLLLVIPAVAQDSTITEVLAAEADGKNPEFTFLLDVIEAADFQETLDAAGPMTFFAPTDEAFELLLEELEISKKELLKSDLLTDILLYHLVEEELTLDDVAGAETLTPSLADQAIAVTEDKDGVLLDEIAYIVGDPLPASNGVIFMIDRVLLPASEDQGGDTSGGGEACIVSTASKNTVPVRVGPGENRTSVTYLPADQEFQAQGRFVADDESVWFQLLPEEAAPGRSMNEAWVAADDVDQSGDCENVSAADAPPVIPIAPKGNAGGNTGNNNSSGNSGSSTGTMPTPGRWTMTFASTFKASCAGTNTATGNTAELGVPLSSPWTVQVSGSNLIVGGDTFAPNGAGSYVGAITIGGTTLTGAIWVLSPTSMRGDFVFSADNCSVTLPFSMSK